MSSRWKKISKLGLFGKIFIVMVISTIAVASMTSWVTVHMSQRLFMNTFSITNSKIIQQIKQSFEGFNYAMVTISGEVMQSGAIKGFLTKGDGGSIANAKAYYDMNEQMKRIQSGLDLNEVGIAVFGVNGRSYFNDRSYWTGTAKALSNKTLERATWNEPTRLSYHLLREDKGKRELAGEWLIVGTKALMTPTTKEIYGTLYLTIRESDFKQFYANFTSTGNDVLILDRNGLVLSSNRLDLVGQNSKDILRSTENMLEHKQSYSSIRAQDRNVIMIADYLPNFDFYIVNLIDKKMALDQMLPVKQILLIGAGIVSVSLFILFLISRRLTLSLRMLVRKMSSVTKRNFHNYITVTGSYETKQLATAFNYMLDELNEYIQQLVDTQREQRNAELAALQRQINPHFLYNTLASVNILVARGDKEKATETIHALISLIQHTISGVAETITVEEELVNLKHYVYINHIRYGSGIRVEYFIAPDCYKAKLPKLILQPFIENAFFHAFKDRSTGLIYVMIEKADEALRCEVVDNGGGIKLEPGEELTSSSKLFTGIGIRNVRDRIHLLYGSNYGLDIESSPGEGTKVRIRLPWQSNT